MQIVHDILVWLDPLFITPYRWLEEPFLAFLLGTFILCVWCVILGDATKLVAARFNRRLYSEYMDTMINNHNLSVKAIGAGDKESYKAVNKQAHEAFGKYFFSQAALFSVSIWPVPFALAWLDMRFRTVSFELPFNLPGVGDSVGYAFYFFPLYILARVLYGRLMRRMPFYRTILARVAHDRDSREVLSFRDLDTWAASKEQAPPDDSKQD